MRGNYVTKSGVELRLKPLNKLAIQDLLYRIGFQDLLATNDRDAARKSLEKVYNERRATINKHLIQVFNYAFSVGIENDPPGDDIEKLRLMQFETSSQSITRLNWLRYIVLADEKEAGDLWGAILERTFVPEEKEQGSKEDDQSGDNNDLQENNN